VLQVLEVLEVLWVLMVLRCSGRFGRESFGAITRELRRDVADVDGAALNTWAVMPRG
jgi:hypothetical protein